MMRPTRLFFTLLVGCTAVSASATDNRMRTLRYDSNQIVRVPGRSSIQSTIEFNSDEHIESVAVGNSAAWQVTPNQRASLLFVKPLVKLSRTNMTVITDKRTYMFDLVTGRREGAAIYFLRFTYPADPMQPKKLEAALPAPAPIPAPASPVELNFGWKTKGAGDILPGRVFDDGKNLYLAWNHDTSLPAISSMASDGREGSLNYRLSGDYIVVTPVPQNVMLRYGKKSASVFRITPTLAVVAAKEQVALPRSAQVVSTRSVVANPTLLSPAQAPQATAPDGRVASNNPPSVGQAAVFQKLAYPDQTNERLTDSHHE